MKKKLIAGLMVLCLVSAPLAGCAWVQKMTPKAQVAMMRVDEAIQTFKDVYPQIQASLDQAIGLKLPNLEGVIMWVELAKMQIDLVLSSVPLPDEADAAQAETLAGDAVKVLDDLNKSIQEAK